MVAHRLDLGLHFVDGPLMAGDPLRLDVSAVNASGQVGSSGLVDFTGAQDLRYAVFAMMGDAPAASPSFVLTLGAGISVNSPTLGNFAILMTRSHTAAWTGRDWHVAKMIDVQGQPFSLFDGLLVSTRALEF